MKAEICTSSQKQSDLKKLEQLIIVISGLKKMEI